MEKNRKSIDLEIGKKKITRSKITPILEKNKESFEEYLNKKGNNLKNRNINLAGIDIIYEMWKNYVDLAFNMSRYNTPEGYGTFLRKQDPKEFNSHYKGWLEYYF